MGVKKFKHAQSLPSNLILARPKSKKVTQLLRIAVQTYLFAHAAYSRPPVPTSSCEAGPLGNKVQKQSSRQANRILSAAGSLPYAPNSAHEQNASSPTAPSTVPLPKAPPAADDDQRPMRSVKDAKNSSCPVILRSRTFRQHNLSNPLQKA